MQSFFTAHRRSSCQGWLLLLLLALAAACASASSSFSSELNCGGDSGDTRGQQQQQCSVSWRTYQINLESAWSVYKRPSAASRGCSVYADAMRDDLAQFAAAGKISRHQVDSAAARGGILYQVIDGRLYRPADACQHFTARCSGVEHYLLRAAPLLSRDAEFVVNVADRPLLAVRDPPLPLLSFSKSRRRHRDILYPAWSFSQGGPCLHPIYSEGIGDWNGTRQQLLTAAETHPWPNKTNVAFFRGSRTSPERDSVVLLSLAKPELFDARYTKNQAYKSSMDTLNLEPAPYVSLPDHCQYRYLINMRGVAASFRLRHILLCGSLVLQAGTEWEEFFYPALRPWIHYVPVADDLRDAEDKLLFLRANQHWASRVAAEGAHFVANHLRDADVACYWVRLLRQLARLLDYKVAARPAMQPMAADPS